MIAYKPLYGLVYKNLIGEIGKGKGGKQCMPLSTHPLILTTSLFAPLTIFTRVPSLPALYFLSWQGVYFAHCSIPLTRVADPEPYLEKSCIRICFSKIDRIVRSTIKISPELIKIFFKYLLTTCISIILTLKLNGNV